MDEFMVCLCILLCLKETYRDLGKMQEGYLSSYQIGILPIMGWWLDMISKRWALYWVKKIIITVPGWWFGTFFIFHNMWDNPSHWLSYFSRWLKPPTRYSLLACTMFFCLFRLRTDESQWLWVSQTQDHFWNPELTRTRKISCWWWCTSKHYLNQAWQWISPVNGNVV